MVENYLEGYHVPIAHPGLMRMLDYKGYEAELHDGWTWFDAPLRDEPSGNRLERLYQRLVRPMPGLSEAASRSLALRLRLSEHRDRSLPGPGQRLADPAGGPELTADNWSCYRDRDSGPVTRLVQRINNRVQQPGARRGHRPGRARSRPGTRTRGYAPGPLAAKEAAVGWFADRIRADLGEVGSGR